MGQITSIIESYKRISGQFEAFLRRIGRSEMNLRRLQLICDDCDELRRLLELNHNHIATIIGSKYDCYMAAVEMVAICS